MAVLRAGIEKDYGEGEGYLVEIIKIQSWRSPDERTCTFSVTIKANGLFVISRRVVSDRWGDFFEFAPSRLVSKAWDVAKRLSGEYARKIPS